MVSRNQREKANIEVVKKQLKSKGWSYRGAAKQLGYSYTHVVHTLTGRRYSFRLLQALSSLPEHLKGQ